MFTARSALISFAVARWKGIFMPGVEKAPYKGGFKRRQLKSYTRRFVAIVGISFALLAGSLGTEFVYVANFISNDVSAYSVGANGALTPVPGSPFSTGFTAPGSYSASVAVDLSGRFVYVANTGDFPASNGSVSAYSIGANGALTSVAGSPFTAGAFPVPWR
jgi:hypothetical protein